MERLDEVMELKDERKGAAPVGADGKNLEETCNTAILMEDVSFGYHPGTPVVEHLELRIPRGQCVGIMGGSGAGKSTIIKLLCGLYEPDRGRIALFGKDIRQTELEDLRSQITYVPQSPLCLLETIAENVRLTNPDATEEEIWEALKKSGASGRNQGTSRGHTHGIDGRWRQFIRRAAPADCPGWGFFQQLSAFHF